VPRAILLAIIGAGLAVALFAPWGTATPHARAQSVTALPPTATPGPSAQEVLDRADAIEKRAQDVVNAVTTGLGVVQVVGVLVGLVGAIVGAAAFVLGITGYRNNRRQALDARRAIRRSQAIAKRLQPLEGEVKQNVALIQGVLKDFVALKVDIDTIIQRETQEMNALIQQRTAREAELKQLVADAEIKLQRESNRSARALAYTQLAQRQFSLGNRDSAMRSLRRALHLDPENPVTSYFLGDLLARSDREKEAVKYLNTARKAGLVEADLSYAYALRLRGDNEPDPTRQEHFYARSAAIFLRHWNDPKTKTLIDISGESAFGALGGMYKRQQRWDLAIGVYGFIAEQVTPQSSYPVNNLALLYLQTGQTQAAMDQFRRSLQIARNKIAGDSTDIWARFDIITANVALTHDPAPDALAEVLRDVHEVIGLIRTPGTLRKLRGGLENLRVIAADLPCFAPVCAAVDAQIAALSAPAVNPTAGSPAP
jgi:tetratricopeptide (TPR) repeat protein